MFRSESKRRRFVPTMETLEARWCPSATMNLADHGHTLVIQGDRGDNRIAIVQDTGGVHVTADDVARNFSGIDQILVDAGAGNDIVTARTLVDPNVHAADLSVRLGAGNDTFNYVLVNPPEPDLPVLVNPPEPDRVAVWGEAGDDVVSVRTIVDPNERAGVDPNFHGVDFTANLGAGNDAFSADLAFPPDPCRIAVSGGEGDDVVSLRTTIDPNIRSLIDPNIHSVDFTADLGAGNDTFSADLAFPPDPCRIAVSGGEGDDVVSLRTAIDPNIRTTVDPNFHSVDFTADLGGGNDTFKADLAFPPDPCRIAVSGGEGDDVVSVRTIIDPNIRTLVDPNFQGVDFTADLGGGNDTFKADLAFPPDPCHVEVMGGEGNDQLTAQFGSNSELTPMTAPGRIDLSLDGGAGNDVIMNAMSHLTTNGPVNLGLLGGAGNDRIIQSIDHLFSNGEFNLNVNGGQGDDDLSLIANARSTQITGVDGAPDAQAFDPAVVIRGAAVMRLESGGGSDHFHADIVPCVEPQGSFDLTLAGGRGADVFDINLTMEPTEAGATERDGPMKLTVLGGAGDDQLTLHVNNLEDAVSPLDIVLQGGAGKDTADVTSGINTQGWVDDR